MKNHKIQNRIYTTPKKPRKRHVISGLFKFLPAIVILACAYSLTGLPTTLASTPTNRVLSYATSMSVSGLLAATNSQRVNNGLPALSINTQLNNAAQTKANDMITRNYWSHTSPTGEEPWYFISNSGYKYKSAGENLAYGFDTGQDTITGWMNSPPHRQNLLSTTYQDVGFGFANSENFVGSGQQTVVVSMYGQSQSQPAPAPAPAATQSAQPPAAQTAPKAASTPIPAATATPAAPAAPVTTPVNTVPASTQPSTAKEPIPVKAVAYTEPINTSNNSTKVRRIQILTGGNAVWSNSMMVLSIFSIAVLWIMQRGRQIRRSIMNGEQFVLERLHLDFTVLSIFAFCAVLMQTTGIVR